MTTAEIIVILILFLFPASVLIGVILAELKVIERLKSLKSFIISALKPLTPLQKEIRDEERTIKQLESQKADIQRLEDLKRKREALFEEVDDKDAKRVIAFVDGIRLPHAFANEKKAIEHIEKCYPTGVEIKWKEVEL